MTFFSLNPDVFCGPCWQNVRRSPLSVTIQCYLVKGSLNICKVTEINCSLGKLRKRRMSASPFPQVKSWMTFPVILIRASLSVKTEWWFQHLQWNSEVEAGVCECRQHFISGEINAWESGNLFPQSVWVSSQVSWIFLSPFAQVEVWTEGTMHNGTSLSEIPSSLVFQAVALGKTSLSRTLLCYIVKKDTPRHLWKSQLLRCLPPTSIHTARKFTGSPRKLDLSKHKWTAILSESWLLSVSATATSTDSGVYVSKEGSSLSWLFSI